MPGRLTEPLSGRDVEHYAASAMHVYHRGQSYVGYDFKVEEIRSLFPNYRIVFVFPWQSAQKKQNCFAVFTSPEAAYDARQHHKAQSWSVEPVDKHKAPRLVDLLQRIEVPKPRQYRRPSTGPAATRHASPPSPSPPQRSPSPSITNAATYRYHDDTQPVWLSSSIKRSANDAFESSSDLEHPSKRRLTVSSATDVPLAVSTPTPQPEVSGPCPSWAHEEIEKLRAQVAQLESKHASVRDIGTMITWISPRPVKVNGHSCDLFQGSHSTAGKVALKRPRIGSEGPKEDIIRRFGREAETWARLRHPHILEYLGTFERDDHVYLVSPFIENGTLVEYIDQHPNANRVRLLCEIADAITYLHQQDVVHGDIKGDNFLISDNDQVLLCDFGLTRTTDLRTSAVMTGAGTLRWQSPELWDGGSKSFKSDVYAFGMTIVEVLTGAVPFPDLKASAFILAVLAQGRRPLKEPTKSSAGLSYEKVWAVAEACWVAGPDERISMTEALQLIREDLAFTSISEI